MSSRGDRTLGRNYWMAGAGLLLILLIGTAYWGWQQRNLQQEYRLMLENERQQAFFELVEHVQDINILLGKTLVASSPNQTQVLLARIQRESSAAAENMGSFPATQQLARTTKFLAQIGDLSSTLAEQTAHGNLVRDEQWQQLYDLQQNVSLVQSELQELSAQAMSGGFNWVETRKELAARLKPEQTQQASGNLDNLEQMIEKFPSLRYDGPFADQNLDQEPRALSGSAIGQAEARKIAESWLPIDPSAYNLTLVEETDQPIPVYSWQAAPRSGSGAQYRIDISQQGGHVVWWMSDQRSGESRLSIEEASRRALQFLQDQGIGQIEKIGHTRMGNDLYVAIAKVAHDTIIYPDLFKVRVSLEDGSILGYDAATYLMNHHDRPAEQFQSPLTPEAMVDALNPRLYILSWRKAIIPARDGRQEVLTYEYRVQLEDQVYLVYLNVQTAQEEEILRVLVTSEGEFTL